MLRKNKPYSLNRRIALMIMVPPLFLLLVMLVYLNLLRTNVETLAETTFNSVVETKQQLLEENLNKIRSITKDIAYSPMLQQYLTESNAREKAQTYEHFQNYLRAVSANSDSIISAYASLGSVSRVHMADGQLFNFEKARKQLALNHPLSKNTEYFEVWPNPLDAAANQMYGMYFYIGSPVQTSSAYQNQPMIGAVMFDPCKLVPIDTSASDHLVILLLNGTPIMLSGRMDDTQLASLIDADISQIAIDGIEYYVAQNTLLQDADMQLLYLVPCDTLLQHSNFWENQTLMFLVLCAVLLPLSISLILGTIFRPIRQLCREVDTIKTYGEYLSTPRAKELAVLTETYNAMVERIGKSVEQEKHMMDQHYQLQIQKRRMEMRAIRNQINPHFLFNTLECINSMVRYYRVEPVAKLITNLSGCFHYSLYSPMMVKLEEEIAHLTNYLEIIESRFPGKYRVIHKVDPEAKEILVPSLLLQPLAENAVTHAFKGHNKNVNPTIVLQAQVEADKEFMTIRIIDNGMGMNEEKLAEVLATAHTSEFVEKHISLNNVYRRLTLLYGPDCMQIVSRNGYYTCISVRVPINQPANIPMNDPTPTL